MNLSIQTKAIQSQPKAEKETKNVKNVTQPISPDMELRNANLQLVSKIKELNHYWSREQKARVQLETELNDLKINLEDEASNDKKIAKENAVLKKALLKAKSANQSLAAQGRGALKDLEELTQLCSQLKNQKTDLEVTVQELGFRNKADVEQLNKLNKTNQRNQALLIKAKKKTQHLAKLNKMLQEDQHKMLDSFTKQLDALTTDSSKEFAELTKKTIESKPGFGEKLQEKYKKVVKGIKKNVAENIQQLNEKFQELTADNKEEELMMSSKLPHIQWTKLSQCHPIKAGLYYVSNGSDVGVAMYNEKTHSFVQTKNNISVDFWCYVDNDFA